jgi:heat shock protein HslJ
MAGPPELNVLETKFLRALERVSTWSIERGELSLEANGQAVARFQPQR